MARFDVYKSGNARGLLLDIQSDLLDEFGSRVVVPLLPAEDMQSVSRLHPVFVINDERYIMSTHLIFAIPVDTKAPLSKFGKDAHYAKGDGFFSTNVSIELGANATSESIVETVVKLP